MSLSPSGRYILRSLALVTAYAVCGRLALLLAIPPGYATAVWPPSGIALAGLLLGGYSLWPAIFLGSLIKDILSLTDATSSTSLMHSLLLSCGISAGATLQALIAAWLIRRFVGYRNVFTQELDIVRILILGGPVACMVNASIAVTLLWYAGHVPGPNFLFSWWTWWVGDTIGVLIFLPIILAWALRPYSLWLRKQIALTVPLAFLFAVVVALFFNVSASEQERLRTEFENRARDFTISFQAAINDHLLILDSMKSFYAASVFVSRDEFRLFASNLLREHQNVAAVEWLPFVKGADRERFERAVRAEGFPDFQIRDRDAEGRMFVAPARQEYFPVLYVEPFEKNRAAFGLDARSLPGRQATMMHAIDSGETDATSGIQLVQDRKRAPSVLIVNPIYRDALEYPTLAGRREHLMGIVQVVLRVDDVIPQSLASLAATGISIRILDMTSDKRGRLLYGSQAPDPHVAMQVRLPVHMANRDWQIEFGLPAHYLVEHRSREAWGWLAAGLGITALLGILILVLIGRQSKVEELVSAQTAELRAAEARFRILLELAPDAMVIINASGRIELVNVQAEKFFGYTRDEMLGQPVELLIPERFHSQHIAHRDGFIGKPTARPMGAGLELSARRKDGSEFSVEISLSPMHTAGRTYVTAAVRDISERKEVEKRLAKYAEDLERSNKELEEFAYVASHDLQAPLRSIVGFSQLLRSGHEDTLDSESKEFLDLIVQSATHMRQLIADLLAFSRVGRPGSTFVDTDCEAVFAQVLTQLQAVIKERGAVVTHDPLPKVNAVPLELNQLLQNLIGNAIKFQPDKTPVVHVSARRVRGTWEFSVRDEGIGIKPEHQQRIFQIFQRLHTSDEYEGTGIGLSICQKIVQHHGGRMWVESEVGKGSTFYFTLKA